MNGLVCLDIHVHEHVCLDIHVHEHLLKMNIYHFTPTPILAVDTNMKEKARHKHTHTPMLAVDMNMKEKARHKHTPEVTCHFKQ